MGTIEWASLVSVRSLQSESEIYCGVKEPIDT